MIRWLRRIAICVFVAAALLFASLVGLRLWADQKYNKYRGEPQVMATPQGLHSRAPIPAYRGPHPRELERPQETFPFPIPLGGYGPIQPLFAADNQYPFLCQTVESGYGQPRIDNQDGIGMAVYDENAPVNMTTKVAGYSKDCELATRVIYHYLSTDDDEFHPYDPARDDVATTQIAGSDVPFVVRSEVGTINRYIYVLSFLAGPDDQPEAADQRYWNQRLLYLFRGGVGIGRRQATASIAAVFKRRRNELAAGYAVAHSSGNRSTNTYDAQKAEDVLLRVKRQFAANYGKPKSVIGIGGSGGAIAQYLIGQNNPRALDAVIAQYSYPDMITQSIPIVDCDLLEHYFETVDGDNPTWASVAARQAVEGLNANDAFTNPIYRLLGLKRLLSGQLRSTEGATECVESWRGMAALVMNPRFSHNTVRYAKDVAAGTHWTYWEDLKHVFGVDETGYAQETWDNEGVQYGLKALVNQQISIAEFLQLNATIGGWRPREERLPERYAILDAAPSAFADFEPFSGHNMRLGTRQNPAKREKANPEAVAAAFWSGQVFLGHIDIPIVDVRHYLEPELDMHHMSASFAARLRMQAAGRTDNQVIWVTEKPHMPVPEALSVLERWLDNMTSGQDILTAKPSDALDRCWRGDATLIAEGQGVWDGEWNGQADGACTATYPIYGNSRVTAGDGYRGDTFKCALQSVDSALAAGVYEPVDMSTYEPELRKIFPTGVCDFGRPDPLRPTAILGGE